MRHRVLSRRASFMTAAAVVAHTIWTSAAPTLTYPLYAQEWDLTTFATTAIFAVYPVFVVIVLVLFGNLSDYIGRRETMLLGLLASTIGSLLFAMAPDVNWIFVGRAFMGIGVGLSAGPSAAAVLEFSAPEKMKRAAGVTAAAQAIGMAGAALVGGALIEYAPLPTRLNFAVLSVVLVMVIVATWHLPKRTASRPHGKWRPSMPSIPNGFFAVFVTATAAVTTAYVLGALTLSLGAQIAHDIVASSNALVNGGIISIFAIASGLATAPTRGRSPGSILRAGAFIGIASSASLALAAEVQVLAVFAFAQIGAGIAYSLLLLGGLAMINDGAPKTHRAGTLSALFLVAYLSQAVVALSLGRVASLAGLVDAVLVGVTLIAFLALTTLLLNAVCARVSRPVRPSPNQDL